MLQLSTPTSTCLVQLLYLDRMPAALKELMLHDRVLKVGVQVKQDLAKLMQDYDVPYAGHVDVSRVRPCCPGSRLLVDQGGDLGVLGLNRSDLRCRGCRRWMRT